MSDMASSSSMSRLASGSGSGSGGPSSASRSNTPNTAAPSSSATNKAALQALVDAERERSPEPDEDFRMDEQPTAWLVKVPRFLYEGWSQITQDDLNLGKVRVYDADHRGKQRIELILPSAPDAPIPLPEYDPAQAGRNVKRIPRQYDVKLSSDANETVKRNLFAFKEMAEEEEEDAAEGTEGEMDVEDADDSVGGADEDDSDDDQAMGGRGNGKQQGGKRRPPQQSRYRKKRPKITTAFAGKITNEAAVKPLLASMGSASGSGVASTSRSASPSLAAPSASSSTDSKTALGLSSAHTDRKASFTPEYRDILRRRKEEATRPKRAVKMLDESESGAANMLMAGLGQGHVRGVKGQPASFVVGQGGAGAAGAAGRGGKAGSAASSSRDKFVRLPKNELLDLLFHCYERYTYWTLKALREETRQPEAYLRDVLASIADQHKRGPYVGQWSLKGEYVEQQRRQQAEGAAQAQQQQQQQQQQQMGGQAMGEQGDEGGGDGDDAGEGDEDMEEVI